MKDREKGNLYHWTQTNFAYHSNRMEGSRITPDQTEMIFEDQTFLVEENEPVRLDDLVEVRNHFRLFDEMLRLLNEPLSWEMILEMHVILKRGTSDEEKPWLGADQFKTVSHQIGMINPVSTTPPEQVEAELAQLLEEYHRVGHPSFLDLLDFHIRFERIHPFSDGMAGLGESFYSGNVCAITCVHLSFWIRTGLSIFGAFRSLTVNPVISGIPVFWHRISIWLQQNSFWRVFRA